MAPTTGTIEKKKVAKVSMVRPGTPAIQLGSGLARYEVGLRLRYEFAKEFAPYIGVSFEQFTGNTASLVAAEGGPTSNLRALIGLKVWF